MDLNFAAPAGGKVFARDIFDPAAMVKLEFDTANVFISDTPPRFSFPEIGKSIKRRHTQTFLEFFGILHVIAGRIRVIRVGNAQAAHITFHEVIHVKTAACRRKTQRFTPGFFRQWVVFKAVAVGVEDGDRRCGVGYRIVCRGAGQRFQDADIAAAVAALLRAAHRFGDTLFGATGVGGGRGFRRRCVLRRVLCGGGRGFRWRGVLRWRWHWGRRACRRRRGGRRWRGCRGRRALSVQDEHEDEGEDAGRPGKAAEIGGTRPQAAAVAVNVAAHGAPCLPDGAGLLRRILALTLPSSRLSSMVS